MKTILKIAIVVVALILLAYRIDFDIATFNGGSTLVIRGESRSRYNYLLRIPPGYHLFSGKRPLLIYLHGAGETGKEITELMDSDPSVWSREYLEEKDYPFITVTPVTETPGWNPERLKILVDELLSNRDRFAIDETRIYITGYSMGGFGTFRTAEEYPELFAAIAPVSGGGDPQKAERLKEIPIWAFHGDADDCVPYTCSQESIAAIQTAGNGRARLTTFPGAGHGIVLDVYRNSELYRWFLQQSFYKRGEKK